MANLHPCPVTGCPVQIGAGMLMCAGDWRRVPLTVRKDVWATWRGGLGVRDPGYQAAARAAIDAAEAVRARA